MHGIKNFRAYFLRGLAALLPTVLTIWIFAQVYIFIRDNVSGHINRGVTYFLVETFDYYPPITEEQKKTYAIKLQPELKRSPEALQERITDEDIIKGTRYAVAERYWVNGVGQVTGFIIVFVGICFIGAFLASFVGKTLWHFLENTFMNLPFVKQVYPHIKQVTDFMLTKKDLAFSKVVAIQYPRRDVWSIGLVTGTGLKKITGKIEKEFLTVFVPTSPTPFTGYVIMTPKEETIELEMSIEEALRFTISAGVITPSEHKEFQAFVNKEDDDDV